MRSTQKACWQGAWRSVQMSRYDASLRLGSQRLPRVRTPKSSVNTP